MQNSFSDITEESFKGASPSGLSADFFERLVSCAEETIEILPIELRKIEEELKELSLSKIPVSLEFCIMRILGDTHFSVDDKVVLFSQPSAHRNFTKKKKPFYSFKIIPIAAGITLTTSLFFWWSSNDQAGTKLTQIEKVPLSSKNIELGKDIKLSPSSFVSHLRDTHDEGTVWHENNQPHRVVRMTYLDQATMNVSNGHPIYVKAPRVEYVVIPEKID